MGLATDAASLWREKRSAEDARDSMLSIFAKMTRGYTSPFYSSSFTDSGAGAESEPEYNPDNHSFSYVAWMISQLVDANPRFQVSSRRVGGPAVVAKAMKHALDRWTVDTDLASLLQMPAVDFLMNYGVVMVTLEDHPSSLQVEDGSSVTRWPVASRIPQDRFFRDPHADSFREIRFAGHSWLADKDDLEKLAKDNKDDGWDLEAIEGLAENTGVDRLFENRTTTGWDVDRREIAVSEMWVREYELDDSPGSDEGFHGTIFTLAEDRSDSGGQSTPAHTRPAVGTEIRKPRPFYGPATGPYCVADCYPVPNEPYALAPLVAIEGNQRAVNRLSRGINGSADSYKRVLLVNSTHDELGEQIASAEHDLVIPVAGLDKNDIVTNVELGGLTESMLVAEQRARETLERISGFTEAARGQVSRGGTATAETIADKNSDLRVAFPVSQWYRFVKQVGTNVAHYFYYEDKIEFALPQSANQDVGAGPEDQVWFQGGDHDPESGYTFADLALEIEPMSMGRVSEASQQRTVVESLGLIAQIVQIMPMAPFVDWAAFLDRWGTALNIPDLGDLIDANMAAQMMGTGGAFPEPQKPRYASTVGQAGVQTKQQPQQPGLPGNFAGAQAGAAQGVN